MRRSLAVMVAALAMVGCSQVAPEVTAVEPSETSAPSTTIDTTTTVAEQDQLEQVALDYFETVAIQSYTSGSGLSEAGSHADLYAFYLSEIGKAYPAGPSEISRVADVTDGQVVIRTSGPDGSSDVVYSDIEVSTEGVVSFAIDGVPISERMGLLGAPVSNAAGVEVSLALIYLSAGGNRFALVEVDNQSGSDWEHQYSASFVASDGLQDDSLEAAGADTIRTGARGLVFFVFDGDPADVSGDLYVDAFINDFATDAGLVLPLG